eukprot:scaffold167432_cov42-Prasinocladus_malaysianus.AAC.1
MADRPRKAKFPHAKECNFCGKCALTDSAEDYALAKGQFGGACMNRYHTIVVMFAARQIS